MARRSGTSVAAVAAAMLLAGGAAVAQQNRDGLAEEEVRSFFSGVQRTAVEAMRSGDYGRLVEWTRDSFADGATVSFVGELHAADERKGLLVVSFDKEDLVRLGRFAVGMLSAWPSGTIEDYDLQVEVSEIEPLGPDAATVVAEYVETASFAPPQAASAASGTTTSAQAGASASAAGRTRASTLQMKASATCRHVVRRAAGSGALALGLSTCEGRVQM